MADCRLMPNVFGGIWCEVYACRKRAEWSLGNPQGPASEHLHLCEQHAKDMLTHLPDEVRDALPRPAAEDDGASGRRGPGGRPAALPGDPQWPQVRAQVLAGRLTQREAAAMLGVTHRTIGRALERDAHPGEKRKEAVSNGW